MAQFRTRARALDLLGRQQIAGIPTAINELIKNAYDAYADHFDASLLRKDGLLVLRDDGIGMSRGDFENRWLTLGTESKVLKAGNMPPIDSSKPFRYISGEKGIGRLAIASIGQQVLVLTKAKLKEDTNIVVAFLDWNLFEIPGLNLEDIVIPVVEMKHLPNEDDVKEILDQVEFSIRKLCNQGKISQDSVDDVISSLRKIHINPERLARQLQGNFDLNAGYGTHFYIANVSESLYLDLQKEDNSDEATKMETTLLGFHNTMTPEHGDPSIEITFRDYRDDDESFVSLIDDEQFFTPDEFLMADHRVKGEFDKYGQFHGFITIYGDQTYEYNINWKDNVYRATSCGPFNIDFAYLQGKEVESRVSTINYDKLYNKTSRIGGLYIYRNNIRVLPYGNSDYDFLDIEKRRTLKASRYFFSYRRMFGAIDISNTEDSLLIEKAGREGFIENLAYKQFRAILKHFFEQLAFEVFGENANSSTAEYYQKKKEEQTKYHKALQQKDKRAKNKKDNFVRALNRFFADLDAKNFEMNVNAMLETLKHDMALVQYGGNSDESSQCLIQAETSCRRSIMEYQRAIAVPSPKGFVMSKAIEADYREYCQQYKNLHDELFLSALKQVDTLVHECEERLSIEISKRKRLSESVEIITGEAQKTNKQKRLETNEAVKSVSQKVMEVTNQLMEDLDAQIQTVRGQFQQLAIHDGDNFDLVVERRRMEEQIESISQRNTMVMDKIIRQLEGLYIQREDEDSYVTNQDIEDAMSEELEDLRTRVNADVELSQLGLAIGIIHHEFSSTVDSIKMSIKDLKAWSEADQRLESLYQNVKVNFEHLDGYLSLLTPLNRRMEREMIDIPLTDIRIFLNDLFGSRLRRHNIKLKHTNGFAQQKVFGYRSSFYPVFVNIVDNAIYWLKQSDQEDKVIRLHADEMGIYISNNGPIIPSNNRERIFDLRYSTKPNGRGLGLAISREVLNDIGYELFLLETPREGATVTFKIQKKAE